MLSYRHAFHAGNHADILKHVVLCATLQYALRKEAALFFLDTHAGAGLYSLRSEQALQTGEASAGILRLDLAGLLAASTGEEHSLVADYAAAVQPWLARRQYPGSPLLAAGLLRRQDHLHLCELHPTDVELLKGHLQGDRRCSVEQADGYQRALALLPPVQKRAVVLIDPSYERKDDYRKVVRLMADLQQRMRAAQLLLWYPVVERLDVEQLLTGLQRSGMRDLWQFELGVAADRGGHGLTASGMLVVNPPFTLPGALRSLLPRLQEQLAPAYGHWKVRQLIGE
jgi:23S rRNA (adenine2030-N6)-methyltransferase